MLFNRALSLLVASATIHQCAADEEAGANELPILMKEEFGTGDVVVTDAPRIVADMTMAALDVALPSDVNLTATYSSDVVPILSGCTGTPTMITIHTPYSTVTLRTDDEYPITYAPAIPTADVTSESRVSTDVDSGLSTATVTSTRTTSISTSSAEDISTTPVVESLTATSSELHLSTSETTSRDAITASNDFGSQSSSSAKPEATVNDNNVSDEDNTASSGGAGRTFSAMGMGALLAFGAWFLGTA
ncbi:uncharacterized protein KD926_000439 [Aspergillus affinis]|uniref:uncharacterized protein n=1 Tax=Aspergillus affinis TaxID=1070780 RepID=UPI0022FF3684|nr:uncharacterized protein KD926_000439 [Aspergillus affinis]KAI9044528.1 hypothetical protein KD926_000439 [Aspergillus affinis]